jgi:endonuclease IV
MFKLSIYRLITLALMGFLMENRNENMSQGMEKAAHGMEKAAETMGGTVIAILDRLAGKKSDLKLSFEDLTLDVGMMKAKVNGAVVLDIVYANEATT